MNSFIIALVVSLLSISAFATTTGQEKREIKSLSQHEITGYLNGKGLGYAKAAELNQFPGPRHVLDLAKELGLSENQVQQSQAIFDAMKLHAIAYGEQFVEKEHKLNELFANSSIDSVKLDVLLGDLGILEAKIRFVHLNAHLEQKAWLSSEQIQLYDQLRGYNSTATHNHMHKH